MRKIYLMDDRSVISGELVPSRGTGPEDALFQTLDNAAVVRRWGTTRGLGQLGLEGPTKETVLDPVPDGHRINLSYVVYEIAVVEKAERKWANVIARLRDSGS